MLPVAEVVIRLADQADEDVFQIGLGRPHAQARLLRQVQRAELAGVGLLAGLLASLVATVVGWSLARFVFNFAWTASPWVPLEGALAGAVLAMIAGWWGLRDVLRRPVVETLRRAPQ